MSDQLGIGADEEFDLVGRRADIIPAIVGFEQGRDYSSRYSPDQIGRAISASEFDDEDQIVAALQAPVETEVAGSGFSLNPFDYLIGSANAATTQNTSSSNNEEEVGPDGLTDRQRAMLETYPTYNERSDMFGGIAGGGSAGTLPNPNSGGADIQPIPIFPDNEIIPPLLQGEDGEPITQGEAGVVPEGHPDEDKPITIVPDPQGTGALVPEDDPGIAEQPDFTPDESSAEEEETTDEPEAPPAPTTTVNVGTEDPTYNVSQIEQEILALQKQMKSDRDADKWLAIAQAGLAIMASDNPTLAGAIGEGGLDGLKAFRDANDRYQEGVIDLINARAKLKGKTGGFTVNQMIQRAADLRKMANDARLAGQEGKARQLELAADQLLSSAGMIGTSAGTITGLADQ